MRALVTGGGGFLGGAIVRRLLSRGHEVAVLARGAYPELERLGVACVRGDVADAAAVRRAVEGRDCVFHVAAKVGLWGRPEDYYRANVTGTLNIVNACQDLGARRLVFTGSPSVVFDGGDVAGWDESAPYPKRFDSEYSRTKALAEELALSASGPKLSVVSLRPHLVWGPGDNHIIRRLIAQAKAGKLRRIAGYDRPVDTTYIDDAAEAHLLAAARLEEEPGVSGRAYFISQGDARPLWSIINGMLGAAGLPPVEREIPLPAARAAACAYEAAWKLLRKEGEPPLTRFLVSQLSTAHWFDISAAKRDLGYAPSVTIEQGMARLKDWLWTAAPA
jgi:nucleoside-diphosphate-sugar epimerase